MHFQKGKLALGGASKKESSREEVLSKAKAEREARNAAKQQQKAAIAIQAAWRSAHTRSCFNQQLQQQWQSSFSAAATQPDIILPACELVKAVRLTLQAMLPVASMSSRQAIIRGHCPIHLHSCLKGTIALVMRSITTNHTQQPFTHPALSVDAQERLSWLVQALQLCQLCCMAVAVNVGASADVVLDAAAARLVQLLVTPAAWNLQSDSVSSASGQPSSSPTGHSGDTECPSGASQGQTHPAAVAAAAAATSTLMGRLREHPMPLLLAVRRCAQQYRLLSGASTPQQQKPAGDNINGVSMTSTALQRLMTVTLSLLDEDSPRATCDPPQQQPHTTAAQQQAFAQRVVQVVLTAPGLVACMPAAVKARLADTRLMRGKLLPAALCLTSAGSLSGAQAAHCLCNLAQLLTGCGASEAGRKQEQQEQAVHSSSLTDPQLAADYVGTAIMLLAAVNQPGGGSQHLPSDDVSDRPTAVILEEGCSMLGTQQHLLPLLHALQQHSSQGMVLWAAYCVHLLHGASGSSSTRRPHGLSGRVLSVLAFAPKLLSTLWDWLAHTAGLPLEAPLQAIRGLDIAAVSRGPEGLPPAVVLVMGLFCRSLAQLLLVLDDADLHQRQDPFRLGTARAIASTLNSLVFHSEFPEAARQLQSPGQQQRQQQGSGQHPAQALPTGLAPGTLQHGMVLLRAYAAVCLRALYDKDARRPFCQPQLWTEPYRNMMARLAEDHKQDASVLATTAAVVQALLVSTGLAGQDDSSSDGSIPGSAAGAQTARGSSPSGSLQQHPAALAAVTASKGAHLPGLRTTALLSLLKAAPQCVPFDVRLELFRQMLEQDKVRGRWGLSPAEGGPRPVKLTVRRDALLEDAFAALGGLGPAIKGRLVVTFLNAQGLSEAGLDHGGLMKELLEQVVALGTQPGYGLFATTEDTGLLYPNPTAEAIPQGLALLEFLGMMVGKALYEGILLNLSFAPFFIRCLQGGRPGLDDVSGLDVTLHTNLLAVKACPPEQVEHLGLTFAAEQQLLGRTVQYNLLPQGDNIPVTASNRLMYVHLLADWHLNARLGRAATAFAGGLSVVLSPSWLRLFSPNELNQLISGGLDTGVDVEDMAKYVRYSNGYSETSHTIKLFWRVIREMTAEQRCALLRFVTSTSRAPLGGFKHLQPPLTIHKVECGASPLALIGGQDVERLPSASTCYNMLKLPNYKRQGTLKQKLLYAIGSGAGFELS